MDNELNNRIKQIIVEHLGVEAEKVTDTALFNQDLGADSLDAMDLLMAVNEEFDTRIPPEDMEKIQTVQDLINAVDKALK